ncbi:hypothetical protein ASPWEDRAFT_167938 [Aspergillus wentii DTO 134E9]|uniref:DUF6594 domain-containing protein n=1 Tax=Aspergillus wentii DTO 134E9 TaxID=1073089 RepID=A0A1L9S436_ASPWE|nr:uncharacterized protein ASPWEDRAFT_167938 [Aspergillus wentii DTO 134E9]OJJ41949.1 hypothetical protein ASPWEDRAFT_167938 [Aspergillus wentii DTO 134E9]
MSTNDPKIGYNLFSSLVNSDTELNVFRAFKELNTRNILYLQSELAELEETFHDLDELYNDKTKGNDTWSIPRSWYAMNKEGGRYLDTVTRMRRVSEGYYKALQTQSWLLDQKPPSSRAYRALRGMFDAHKPHMSRLDASFILEDAHRDDLIALLVKEKEALSRFLAKYLYRLFEEKRITNHSGELSIISDERIQLFVRVSMIILSSVLPILSIIVLYVVKSQSIRLGLVVVFSALCSAALATMSGARNAEIMGVTAAYAAVQVVFVSGS